MDRINYMMFLFVFSSCEIETHDAMELSVRGPAPFQHTTCAFLHAWTWAACWTQCCRNIAVTCARADCGNVTLHKIKALGLGLVARDAAAFCVAGAAQTHIYRRFAWQVWHKLTSTVVLRGRRGTDGTGWRAWSWFSRP